MYVKLRIVEGRQGSLELLFDQKRRLLPAFDHVVADLPVRAATGFGDECRGHRWGIEGRSEQLARHIGDVARDSRYPMEVGEPIVQDAGHGDQRTGLSSTHLAPSTTPTASPAQGPRRFIHSACSHNCRGGAILAW